MKIIELDTKIRMAVAELAGNRLSVDVSLVDAKPGDQVLVHAGCALQVLRETEAAEILKLLDELESVAHDGS